MGVNRTNALPPEQQVRIWNKKLRQEAPLEDCFTNLRGVYTTSKRVDIGNEIFIDIGGEGKDNERFHRMTMQKDLSGAPREGSTANQVTNEEDLIQKVFDIFYTDWSHAVSLQSYGIEAKTKDYWGIFEQITPKLALYAQEYEGKYIREALLERYDQNLTAQPHNLVQDWSPNIAVAGLHSTQWPVYNTNVAAWTNAIGTALTTAGVGAQASATIRFIQQAEENASARRIIEPLNIGGKECYIVVLPSPQCVFLKDPVIQGNLGSVFRDVSALSEAEMNYPGVIGKIGRCLIVEDPRHPTLTLGGTAGGYTLTSQYRLAGREVASDPRDFSLTARQVGYLLGKAAIAKWNPEPFHWEYEYEQYDKFGGKGIFTSWGFQMVQWDYGPGNTVNVPTAATRQQDSSMVLLFSTPPLLV